jgi:hypothetical protein
VNRGEEVHRVHHVDGAGPGDRRFLLIPDVDELVEGGAVGQLDQRVPMTPLACRRDAYLADDRPWRRGDSRVSVRQNTDSSCELPRHATGRRYMVTLLWAL